MEDFLQQIEEEIKRKKRDYQSEIYRLIGVACITWSDIKDEEEKERAKKKIENIIRLYDEKYK